MQTNLAVSRLGAVLRIVFDRPEKRNALDQASYLAAIAALETASADDELRVVLLSGAGGVFTAGNDLADFRGFDPSIGAAFPALRFVKALAGFEKPVVAAVAGDAIGVGTTMLFLSDLVYAAPNARFKMPFVDLGLPPEAGASLLAPLRFGHAKAAQYLMLGEAFDAEEALRLNLVNAVVEPDLLDATALGAAQRLAQKPMRALMETRRLLRGDVGELQRRIDEEARVFFEALQGPEAQARFAAFLAKSRG
jgi:enoyl-CoA hydratase/carnithine racemase